MQADTAIRAKPFDVDGIMADTATDRAIVINRQIKSGANRMLVRTARGVVGAHFALYRPFQALDYWRDWSAVSVNDLLKIATDRAAAMREAGRERHWTYSYSAHCAWIEAAIALRYLRRFFGPRRLAEEAA